MSSRPSIVFFGNPDFALTILEGLVESGFHISLVVTSEDRPSGRHLKLKAPEVKTYAIEKNIPFVQPTSFTEPTFLETLRGIAPDVMVVVAFKKLPPEVWSIPKWGTLNVHPSLLPDYRGAAPIHWAIIRGEKETGVSVIRISDLMDGGDILKQIHVPIDDKENLGKLYTRLKYLGKDLLVETINDLNEGKPLNIVRQEHLVSPKKAPKIKQATCQLDFSLTAQEVYNKVRGLSPYPTAFTYLGEEYVKVFSAEIHPEEDTKPIGHVVTDFKHYLRIRCQDHYLDIKELQAANKKRLVVEEFLKGWKPLNIASLNG